MGEGRGEGREWGDEAGEGVLLLLCKFKFTGCHYISPLTPKIFLSSDSTQPRVSETTPAKRPKTSMVESPHHFFLHLLLKHQQGLWETGVVGGEKGEKRKRELLSQWERCTEYFDFRCRLLQNLKSE